MRTDPTPQPQRSPEARSARQSPTCSRSLADPPQLGPPAIRVGCAVEGCDAPHRCRGLCKRHYDRALYATDAAWRERKRAYAMQYCRTRRGGR